MSQKWDMKKSAEECSELATILIQQLNKPHKDLTDRIIEELGDVTFRLDRLKTYYDSDKVTKRILEKISKEELKDEKSNKRRSH